MHTFEVAIRTIKEALPEARPALWHDIRVIVMHDVDVNLRRMKSGTQSSRVKPRKKRPLLAWISTHPNKRYAFLPRRDRVFATGFVLRE